MGKFDCPKAIQLEQTTIQNQPEWPTLSSSVDTIRPRPRHGPHRSQHRQRRVIRKEPERVAPRLSTNTRDIIDVLSEASVSDLDTITQCIEALQRACAAGPVFQDEITKLKGIEMILHIMNDKMSVESVQLMCLCALEKILEANLRSTLRFVSAQGVEVLLSVMNKCGNTAIQISCCKILRYATLCNSDCQAQIGASKAIESILWAMQEHIHDPQLQIHGCRVLKELGAFHPLNQERIVEKGGIALILSIMQIHMELPQVPELACGVLRNLSASNASYQDDIVSRDGVILVLKAMAAHASNSAVQWACCWLLFCLAVHNAQSRRVMTALSVVPLVLTAMREHREEARVQEACCWFLKAMAPNIAMNQNQGMLLACIQAVLKTMERSSESKVQSAASGALCQFSSHDTTGKVRTISLGRCGRLGRNSTMRVLSVIEE